MSLAADEQVAARVGYDRADFQGRQAVGRRGLRGVAGKGVGREEVLAQTGVRRADPEAVIAVQVELVDAVAGQAVRIGRVVLEQGVGMGGRIETEQPVLGRTDPDVMVFVLTQGVDLGVPVLTRGGEDEPVIWSFDPIQTGFRADPDETLMVLEQAVGAERRQGFRIDGMFEVEWKIRARFGRSQ